MITKTRQKQALVSLQWREKPISSHPVLLSLQSAGYQHCGSEGIFHLQSLQVEHKKIKPMFQLQAFNKALRYFFKYLSTYNKVPELRVKILWSPAGETTEHASTSGLFSFNLSETARKKHEFIFFLSEILTK